MQPVGAMESSTQMMVLSRGKMTNLMITHITDLPAVVLGSILAHLNDPVDVAAALCTCKLFWTLARTAPFQLRLRPRQPEEPPGGNSEDSLQNKYAISTEFSCFYYFFGRVQFQHPTCFCTCPLLHLILTHQTEVEDK